MKLKVFKVRENAKLPVRAHTIDAGADLFYCPEVEEPITIFDNTSELLQTGLKIGVPEGYMLEIKNKSGVAFKKSLVVGACVVDSGYNGEVFVNLHNLGAVTQTILPGEKIAQAVLVPIVNAEFEEISVDDVYGTSTGRGAGALGSTGDF
jgi:dUTP pyrophosphatase